MNQNQNRTAMEATVRVCAGCGRPVAARRPAEYTMRRAVLIAERGLCVCGAPPPAGPVPGAPHRADGDPSGPPLSGSEAPASS